jgi:Cupin-like domain
LATNLLNDVEPALVAAQLLARGVSADRAAAAIAAVRAHPIFRVAAPLADTLRRREALLLIRSVLAKPAMIARVPTLSRERFLVEHYAVQHPVVVTAAMATVPALDRWTFEYLAEMYGALEIEIQDGRSDERYQRDFARFCRRTTLRELLARIHATPTSNDFYLTAKNRLLEQPGAAPLLADLQGLPDLFATPLAIDDAAVWIGPGGTRTPLHHDWLNLAIVQLRGRKRVHLVPAWEAPLVGNIESRFADVDAEQELAAHVTTIELVPGELVFIPVGWFHQVHALEPSISLTVTNFAAPNRYVWNTDTRR